jgi:hypothetical protein
MATITTATITAQNTFSDPVKLEGYFNFSLSGTFDATVTVQRSTDAITWVDVDTFTAPTEDYGFDPEIIYYRVGVKTGDYVSGSAVVRLGREDKDRH